jgi:hypothetical protein
MGFCGATMLGILGLAFLLSLTGCSTSHPTVALGSQLEAMPDCLPFCLTYATCGALTHWP